MNFSQMKKSQIKKLIVFFVLILNVGCSSSSVNDKDVDFVPALDDAGTDALPQASAEDPLDQQNLASAQPVLPQSSTPQPSIAPEVSPSIAPIPPVVSQSSMQNTTSIAPVASNTDNSQFFGQTEDYTVQTGDTLMRIAFEIYGDLSKWKTIYEANRDRIPNPNAIDRGTIIKVEKPDHALSISRNGEKYLIQPGDTLGKISEAVYGTTAKWRKIWKNNKELIHNPNKIFAGFYIYYLSETKLSSASKPSVHSMSSSVDTSNFAAKSVQSAVPPAISAPSIPQEGPIPQSAGPTQSKSPLAN